MPFSQDTLAQELQKMVPVDNEPAGINNFAEAWEEYFSESTVAGATVVPGTLAAAPTALKTAMGGVANVDSAKAIADGIDAFWGVVETSAATIWITVPPLASATKPPTLGAIEAAVAAAGTANIAAKLSLEDSADAIATAIHPNNLGGLAKNTAVPPVDIPIL